MTERKLYPVYEASTFVEWALRAKRPVWMKRTPACGLQLQDNGLYGHRMDVRVDYGFDVISDDDKKMDTWTFCEVCRVRPDGEIVFKEDSPYTKLKAVEHEMYVRR